MPLLQRSDRPSAERLLSRLDELSSRVPREARRFHEVIREFVDQTAGARGRRILPGRGEELRQLAEEVERLEATAPRLSELFAQADGVRRKIRDLRRRLAEQREPGESAWIEELCVRWEAGLETLGITVPREAAVTRARDSVAEIEASVDLHDEAVDWLERGRRVLRGLAEHGLEVEGAALEADLPAVTEAFRSEGPSRKSIDELAGRVRELEDRLSSEPQEAPREYSDAAGVLDEVEEWHRRALEPHDQLRPEDVEALAQLRARLETARQKWRRQDPEDADAVLAEARDLHEEAAEGARQRRADALHELRQQVRTLTRLAGRAEAEDEAAELGSRTVEGPRDHSLWWDDFERAWAGFLAEAEIHGDELAERRADRHRKLEALLGTLSGTPMDQKNRSRLYRLEGELRELERSSEVKEVLRDLQDLDRLQEDAETLRADVEEAHRDLEARRAEVVHRIETLREEARRAGVDPRSLDLRGEDPAPPDTTSTLEEAEEELSQLQEEADRAEAEIVEACSRAVREATAAVERIARILGAAGSRPDLPATPPPLPADAGVTEAADALAEARRLQTTLETEAAAAWDELTARRDALLARIEALHVDTLRPGDRDDARRLAEALAAGPWDETESPADRIELLLPVVERTEELFVRLAAEEDEARRRLAALRRRFDRSRKEGLHDACGELADRVEALLRGVPEEPVRWPPVLHQIDRAEEFLGRLEAHARRLAVAELGAAVDRLEERRHREKDPETDLVLSELAELDPHELPSTALRRRIVRAARGHGDATGRRRHG